MTATTQFTSLGGVQQALVFKLRQMAAHLVSSLPEATEGKQLSQQGAMALNLIEKSRQLGDAETLVRLLENFGVILRKNSHAGRLDQFFVTALERDDLTDEQRVNLASLHALLLIGRGELERAERALNGAWLAAHTATAQAELYNRLGVLQEVRADFAESKDTYLRALDLLKDAEPSELHSRLYNNLGNWAYAQDLLDDALEYYGMALSVAEAVGDIDKCATAEAGMAMTYGDLKQYDVALRFHEAARRHFEQVNHGAGLGRTDLNLSLLYIEQNNADAAKLHAGRALMRAREMADAERETTALHNLGRACLLDAEYEAAYTHLEAALMLRRQMGMRVFTEMTEGVVRELIEALEADAEVDQEVKAILVAKSLDLLKGAG